ncbi:YceI family protein [Rhodococcus tibetensis]|uniref:YceI family protein n=1 Tax=Rhodococcus tibetensis TaxID=2965064 RepID=A0ABT1QDP1_9NOCA|nr:YceI family protein [Rhodococcus sp. FXJ9.536]MCQ4120376.1 YceI family protein [Rhodococcus sp. FXJ9.536]
MKKLWLAIGGIVAVVVLAVLVGPWAYGRFIAEDDAPAASVSTEGAEAASGPVDGQWTVAPGEESNQTSAGYTVHEILNGASVTVVGSTGEVTGSATVEAEKLIAGEVSVQVAGITTDQSRRDNQFRGNVMDTDTYPTATFTVDEPVDLSGLPADGSVGTVTAQGTLTLKGQSRPVTVDIDVLRSGDDLIASGSIPVTWTDFGVQPPSLGFVTVDGSGTVDFLVSLARS